MDKETTFEKKKKFALSMTAVLMALIIICIGTGGLLAYLTATGEITNNHTIGQVTGNVTVEYDKMKLTDTEATTNGIPFKVFYTNDKGNPVAVRMRMDFSDASMLHCVNFLEKSAKWSDNENGFYYYEEILPAEKDKNKTEIMFKRLKVTDTVNIDNFDIYFRVETRNCDDASQIRSVFN